MQDLLKIENIAKDYNGVNVINDISISIKPGEIIGLLGPNGAGKTTTIGILTGLVNKTSCLLYTSPSPRD